MPITFQTTDAEQKQIRAINKNPEAENYLTILEGIHATAVARAGRKIK